MEVIKVDTVDLAFKEDGKYKKEYRGNLVTGKYSGDSLYIFSRCGREYLYMGCNNTNLAIDVQEFIKAAGTTRQPESESVIKRKTIDDLRALRKDFETAEIIQLHEAGLI